jgi:hypothetical protein
MADLSLIASTEENVEWQECGTALAVSQREAA